MAPTSNDDFVAELNTLLKAHVASLGGNPLTQKDVIARRLLYTTVLMKDYRLTADEFGALFKLAYSLELTAQQVPGGVGMKN